MMITIDAYFREAPLNIYHLTRCCKKDMHVKFEKNNLIILRSIKDTTILARVMHCNCTRNLCYSKGEGPKKLILKTKSIAQNT